ncbi:hypothetical protein [Streptomyces apocyni]|uniref:hypothetical protein n=1 Tax=Streptomyces apocyni TaxID=2654677 RepID=UPI0012EA46FD|nr:hypothetical protein [Streptomyces apocyni]
MGEKMKFSVSLDADLGQALRDVADEQQTQISSVVSHALRAYLDDERIIRDGLAAMEQYQEEHGRFTTDEKAEAHAWVRDLMGWDEAESRQTA